MSLQSQLFRGDPKLEAAAVSDPAHVVPGAVGDHVGKIQQALITLDGAVIDQLELIETRYGPSTASAVLAYKTKRGIINRAYQIKPDNIVGKMTMASLDSEMLNVEASASSTPPVEGASQAGWQWCNKCQGLAFSLNQPSVCPAGGSHDHIGSGNYTLAVEDPSAQGQPDWRWCNKCQGLAFSLSQPSVCPAGGSHDHSQSGNYTLSHNDPSAQGQSDWRWCSKCQGLAFSLNQPSVCPAGGSHDHSSSGNYTLLPSSDAGVVQPSASSDFENPDFILNEAVGQGLANTQRDVIVLQRLLDTIPYDRGGPRNLLPLSGQADSDTLGSIKRFQSFMDLPSTGAVAPLDATYLALIQTILGMGCTVFGRDDYRVVDATLYSPDGRTAYFFAGNGYVRYSVDRDLAEPYHERRIKLHWKLPFYDDIRATIWYPRKQKAYFFRGDKYVRYTLSPEGLDFPPKDISPSWGKLWGSDLDAALWWPEDPNSNLGPGDRGVVFFFKEDKYVKFDPYLGPDGDVMTGYPKNIAEGWKGLWPTGIDAAIWWPPTKSAYFFRGDSYIKWDRMNTSLGPDGGVPREYPKLIREGWEGLDQFAVFAANVLLAPCRDARPGGNPPQDEYDHGEPGMEAQAGWDLGISFGSLEHLVEQLVEKPVNVPNHKGSGPIAKHQITRLGMAAHGAFNRWDVKNYNQNGEKELNETTLPKYEALFRRLAESLTQRAVVIFHGCNVAPMKGSPPSLLLKISKLLPGRLLVGFSTTQHVGGSAIPRGRGTGCDESGVKDTPWLLEFDAQRHTGDWNKWPWASEYSPNAVLARDGMIIPSVP
jgi:peptidoglycan hydrolase-like protein with peptidoglycan-binding domain